MEACHLLRDFLMSSQLAAVPGINDYTILSFIPRAEEKTESDPRGPAGAWSVSVP